MQKLQLEIYFQELQQLAGPTRCVVAALTILDQPFPTVLMRQKQMEEPLVVQVRAHVVFMFNYFIAHDAYVCSCSRAPLSHFSRWVRCEQCSPPA